jgi:SAM-dependent methyltransferase
MAAGATSYDPVYFAPLYAVEERHFWFRARNQVIGALAAQVAGGLAPGYRALEVGCGTGNVLRELECVCAPRALTGMDLFAEGLHFARRRVTCALLQGDVLHPPFSERFGLIGLFDVLEHLPNDVEILRALRALLAPGGALLLTVPAHRSLWSYFDEASHHVRRYAPDELAGKLAESGYRVEYLSQYMAALFPMMWLGRRVAGLLGRTRPAAERTYVLASNELRVVPVANEIAAWWLGLEARLIAGRRRLPMGTSLVAVARPLAS